MLRVWWVYALPHGLCCAYYDFGPGQGGDMLTCFQHELKQRLEELARERRPISTC
jgi:hypothetical protein